MKEPQRQALEKVYQIIPELKGFRLLTWRKSGRRNLPGSSWETRCSPVLVSKARLARIFRISGAASRVLSVKKTSPGHITEFRREKDEYLEPGAADLEMWFFSSEESIPAWVDKSKLKDHLQQRPQFSFQFTVTHQGIPVVDRSYSVQVDALTGKVTGFNGRNGSSPVTLPDSKNVVTADAAKAEFLKHHPLRLVYIWPEYFEQKAPSPHLVYLPTFRDWDFIDALTGKTVVVERN